MFLFGLQLGFQQFLLLDLLRSFRIIGISHLFVSDLILHGTTRWDMQILQSVFDPISIRAISQIRISTYSKPSFLWTHSCSGCFTTNSAYLAILGANLSTLTSPPPLPLWKAIWKLNLNDRLRLFLWKIA